MSACHTRTPEPQTVPHHADLASGCYALIEDGLGFSRVPWQPVLDQQIGRRITGIMRGDGGIEWHLGRELGPES